VNVSSSWPQSSQHISYVLIYSFHEGAKEDADAGTEEQANDCTLERGHAARKIGESEANQSTQHCAEQRASQGSAGDVFR